MRTLLLTLLGCVAAAGPVFAGDVRVTLAGVHICCNACVTAVNGAVKGVADARVVVDKDGRRILIAAKDAAAAQSAVDALAAAGFHGKSDNKEIAMKDDSGVSDGKVTKLDLTGHNCCGKCAHDMDAAAKSVAGVKNTTLKPKIAAFTVNGNFDAKALVKALNDAGFHVVAGKK